MTEKIDIMAVARDDRNNVSKETLDFGFKDRLGRSVGCRTSTWQETWVAAPDDYQGFHWKGTPGEKFVVWAHNTRDGVNYGGAYLSRAFDSAEKRDAFLLKYLNSSSGKLRKKFEEYNR